MRQDWKTEQVGIPFQQNLVDYPLDTTNGFKISNPSTSKSVMSRLVNLVPYKHGEVFTFKKRPGCVSSVSINSTVPTPREGFRSANGFIYAGGNSGNYCQALAYNGTTQYLLGPTVGFGISGTAAMGFGEIDLGTLGKCVMFTGVPISTAPTYVPANYTTVSEGYLLDESDLVTATYGPVTGNCSVTNASTSVTGIASTAKFKVGQVIAFTYSGTTQWRTVATIPGGGTTITVDTALTLGTVTAVFDKGYIYKITSQYYPGNAGQSTVGRLVSLGGYAAIMTKDGNLWNSDINAPFTWQSYAHTSAQQYEDTGMGALRYRTYILAFGEYSIEFFKETDSISSSNLQVSPELTVKIGVRSPKHFDAIEDTVAFISNGKDGSVGVYLMDDLRPRKVSSGDVDYILSKLGPTNFELHVMTLYGKRMIVLNSLSSLASAQYISMMYYLEDDLWVDWKVTEAGTATDYTHPWQFPAGAINDTVYAVSPAQATNGPYITKYQAETDGQYYDNLVASSKVVTAYVQTPIFNFKTNRRKFMSKLHLIHKSSTSYNPGANVTVYWSDDNGQTWRSRPFSSTLAILSSFGSFRKRIFRIVEATTGFYEIHALEIELRMGGR